jgi:L-alanine-DL-glutamate epimerase-like enolase superfamily enzyme
MWYGKRSASIHPVTFIETDDGITGVSTEGDPKLIMENLRPKLIGKDPFNIEKIEAELGGAIRGRWEIPTRTMSAIDGALWDIVGKSCGKPLYKIWGGKMRNKVPVRYWMCCRSPKEQASEAVRALESGWKAFKIKLGTDPKTDMERVKAVRDAVGNNVQLCFDINGSYTPAVAINTLRRMARYEPAYVEDPIPNYWPYDSGSLDAMADIRRITGIPIEAHSHGPNCLEFAKLVVEKRAADAIHLNVSFTGGVLEAKRVCAIADAGGLIVTGQSSAAELGPRNALLLHLITSERAFKGSNDSSTHHLTGDIIKKEFKTVEGTLKVPEGPGLGVEIDEEKLKKYHEIYRSGLYQHEPGLGKNYPHLWY